MVFLSLSLSFVLFSPLYLCFERERSNSQKCGNFDYLIFRDFQLPVLLKFPIEETLLLYFFWASDILSCLEKAGRGQVRHRRHRLLKKSLPRRLSGWFVVGFLKGLLRGSEGTDTCLSLHVHWFSEALREHFSNVWIQDCSPCCPSVELFILIPQISLKKIVYNLSVYNTLVLNSASLYKYIKV